MEEAGGGERGVQLVCKMRLRGVLRWGSGFWDVGPLVGSRKLPGRGRGEGEGALVQLSEK